jgi:hypothetical protein
MTQARDCKPGHELRALGQQFSQRLNLARDPRRREIIQASKAQLNVEVRSVIAQPVHDLDCEPRRKAFKHVVEVIEIYPDPLSILERGCQLFGLTGKVCKNQDFEGQFPLLDGAVRLDFVRQVYARSAHALDSFLQTVAGKFIGHGSNLRFESDR